MTSYKKLVTKIPIPADKKIKQKQYLPTGCHPVVDQGLPQIGGYSNDSSKIISCGLPVIVFGDHTKHVKFIDFPFCAGADGIKILSPKPEINAKFLFYGTQYLTYKIVDKGYARHYQHIEKQSLYVPPIPEQERIVSRIEELFSQLDAAVAELQTVKEKLNVYRQAVLKEAFENSVSMTNNLCTIDDLLTKTGKGMTTGPFGTMLKKNEHKSSGIPVLGIENIGKGIFLPGNKIFITKEKAAELSSFRVREGDIIISRSGTVGEICAVPADLGEAYLSTNLMKISLDQQKINSAFFIFLFQSKGVVIDQVKELCKGSTRDFLNQRILKQIKFPVPSLECQEKIVNDANEKTQIVNYFTNSLELLLRRAFSLRQSILKQAFEGNL